MAVMAKTMGVYMFLDGRSTEDGVREAMFGPFGALRRRTK